MHPYVKAASEEMRSGQLIHGDAFDLFQVIERCTANSESLC